MQLVEKHIIKTEHKFFKQIDALCLVSKNLYNSANFVIWQNFIYSRGYLNYQQIYVEPPKVKANGKGCDIGQVS